MDLFPSSPFHSFLFARRSACNRALPFELLTLATIDGFYSPRTLATPFRAVDPLFREASLYRTMKPTLGLLFRSSLKGN
jgi:hypothetical protein